MSRISKAFKNQEGFVGYLTAGDAEKRHFLALLKQGVNVLEIGIPFSDPVADGEVIQQAMKRALELGTTVEKVLQLTEEIREQTDVAIVLFTYFNPIQKALARFLKRAKEAGADGILVVDLPIEEAEEYRRLCSEVGLAPIFVIAPSTPKERIAQIAKMGEGFLYYACRKGTTGTREGLPEDLEEKISQIRSQTDLPIAVGFGFSKQVKVADGVVIGSYFVKNKEDL